MAGVSGAICWGEDSGKPASPEAVDGDSVGVGLAKRSVARSTPGWGAGSLRPCECWPPESAGRCNQSFDFACTNVSASFFFFDAQSRR